MKTFRTLELATNFYQLAEKTNLTGPLRDQLIRASSSISLNLAEGNAKTSVKEKKRYYQTAYGSLKECQTIFTITRTNQKELISCADHLGACLYKLMKSNIKIDG